MGKKKDEITIRSSAAELIVCKEHKENRFRFGRQQLHLIIMLLQKSGK